ncbi:unnamed protein product [Bursaphelenchus okinawaensis]|uniref:Tetratricopeptide repeat protein 30 n=1 Tax=Bursaphelenchus okinawaensis TaxID=465554 RepID=A0A811JWB9_9BILA|nr:unnamed protein product [Bursaphelenchus okinawaensis]CAG9086084.1 unnamed protein product [Bursaphelenchus okinawaensis]
MAFVPIRDGEYTSTIYGMIRDNRFADAMRVLQYELQRMPNSRAALSLLGYCYYHVQDFLMAAEAYGKLSELYPDHSEYKLYHAQCLYHAFMFPEAEVVIQDNADNPEISQQLLKLAAAIKYTEDDVNTARLLVEQYDDDDPDQEVNLACIDYKIGDYDKAIERFKNATSVHGFQADLAYSLALCHYELGETEQTMRYIADIVERGVKDHPELGVGTVTDGIEVRSVGNTIILNETALIEAFNLRFAIEYKAKNMEKASACLTDMPPRSEEELDAVTLHNQALMSVETNFADSFAKLQYLLSQNPFPPETFANLLLLYCKYEYYDLAADVLAENAHLTYKYLDQYMFDYLDALISQQSSPTDAYSKFDALSTDELAKLRKAHQNLAEATGSANQRGMEKASEEIQNTMDRYIPVLMAQARIVWEREEYSNVESLFSRSYDLCQNNDTWLLNMAHTVYMQAIRLNGRKNSEKDEKEKYKIASGFYDKVISKRYDKILDVSAIVLANACVCYILDGLNESAEDMMKRVEKEEMKTPKQKSFHFCIINLVIGTLYCAKGNYEFGITRIIGSLEPYEQRLGLDTWYFSKRCMLAMFEQISKQILMIRDEILMACLTFLEQCEVNGKNISTHTDGLLVQSQVTDARKTVAYEARILKSILLRLLDL